MRLGLFLATVPIGYFIYVLIDQRLSGIFQPYADFELLSILSALVYEVAFWGVAAFAFGCLYAYLPFGNGVLRGAAFSLPFIAANGLSELVPGYQGDSQWLFRSVELLLFTTLLGLLLDLRTVRSERFHWRNLIDLYQVRSLRFGIVNLAPLLLPSCSPHWASTSRSALAIPKQRSSSSCAALPDSSPDWTLASRAAREFRCPADVAICTTGVREQYADARGRRLLLSARRDRVGIGPSGRLLRAERSRAVTARAGFCFSSFAGVSALIADTRAPARKRKQGRSAFRV